MVNHVYIIVQNGDAYPDAYTTYASAVYAVKIKNREILEEDIREAGSFESIERILSDVNVPENIQNNITYLYIEKGINIKIYKLPIS
jgi:hypothetical protein